MTRTVKRGPVSDILQDIHTYLFNRDEKAAADRQMKSVYGRVSEYVIIHGEQDERGSFWQWFAKPLTIGKKTYYGLKRQAETPATIVDEEAARELLDSKGISLAEAERWSVSLPERITAEQSVALADAAKRMGLTAVARVEYDFDDLLYRLATEKKISENDLDKVILTGIWKNGEFLEGETKYSLVVVEEPPPDAE